MNLHNLRTVACYNSKLLLRSWLFRFFFFLMFCIIIVYHVVSQSDLFPPYNSGLITLSSFIPFMNAYWFTILQTIPLCFLAGMFLVKEKKIDSMDAIYYRPESNAGNYSRVYVHDRDLHVFRVSDSSFCFEGPV